MLPYATFGRLDDHRGDCNPYNPLGASTIQQCTCDFSGSHSGIASPPTCESARIPPLAKALLQVGCKPARQQTASGHGLPSHGKRAGRLLHSSMGAYDLTVGGCKRLITQNEALVEQHHGCHMLETGGAICLQAAMRRVQCMQETSSRACWLTTCPNTSSTGTLAFFPAWYCAS